MKRVIIWFVAALVVCSFPAKGFAAAEKGDVEISLFGSGLFDVGNEDTDYSIWSGGVRIGYYWSPMWETALGISAANIEAENVHTFFNYEYTARDEEWAANLEALVNIHISMAEDTKFDPYLGVALGFVFVAGNSFFTAGVQAGVKYWINENVSIFTEVQYRRWQAPDFLVEKSDPDLMGGVVGVSFKF